MRSTAHILPKPTSREGLATQTALQTSQRTSNALPFADGQELEVTLPAGGNVTVLHRLARGVRGYLVMRAETAAPDFFLFGSTKTDVTFTSAIASKVTLWVF